MFITYNLLRDMKLMLNFHEYYFVTRSLRYLSTSAVYKSKNHYDALGITPKATQNEVKQAYYKLSKLYHPDMNDGSHETSEKFRQVSEAYEVLGNIKLRQLYDRGASNIGKSSQYSYNPREDPSVGFQKSRERRTRPPTSSGGTPIYDFDEWSKAHYGATFARDMFYKNMMQMENKRKEFERNETKLEQALMMMFISIFCSFFFLSYAILDHEDYDKVRSNPSKIKKKNAD